MNLWTLAFEALTVPQTGTSVLQAACIMGDHVTVKAILSTSPSPLDTAIALHYKVVDKNSSFSGKTAAQIVQRFNTLRHKIIQSMIKNADKILVSESCVHLAAKIGEPRHISQLINLGDPVDKLSGPLYGFSSALSIAVAGNRTEVVRALIRHGASIEAVDQHGFSAMQQAALHGAMDTLRLLFDVVTARDTHYKRDTITEHDTARGCDTARECGASYARSSTTRPHTDTFFDKTIGRNTATEYDTARTYDIVKERDTTLSQCNAVAVYDTVNVCDMANQRFPSSPWRGFSLLHLAAYGGHDQTVLFIISSCKLDVNCRTSAQYPDIEVDESFSTMMSVAVGATPLMMAALTGHVRTVDLLLHRGSGVNLRNNSGQTPPFYAVFGDHVDIVKTFVSHGADINVKDYDNNSLLHASKQAEMSLFLLQTWSLSPGAKNRFGETALHRVARLTGMIKVASVLLDNGASVNVEDNLGRIPLHHVTSTTCSPDAIAVFIARGSNATHQDHTGKTCLHLAARCLGVCKSAVEQLTSYEEAADNGGRTALHDAVTHQNTRLLQYLLDAKSDVNRMVVLEFGESRHSAAALHYAVWCQNLGMTKLLVQHGAEVNILDELGKTPLHYAAKTGWTFGLIYLLNNCADPMALTSHMTTALHFAAGCSADSTQSILALLNHRVSLNSADSDGRTPLHWACRKGNPRNVEFLLSYRNNVKVQDVKVGATPLYYACGRRECLQVVDELIRIGSDVNVKTKSGNTALHRAIACDCHSIARLLIQKRSDVTTPNHVGLSPSNIAIFNYHKNSTMLQLFVHKLSYYP